MEDNIKQIGERLRGLREVLNVSASEVAELCEISLDYYLKIEAGEADPSVYRLSKISKRYGIALDVLLFGDEPRMGTYFLTRCGQGKTVERSNNYKYQSLASGFRGSKFNPFMTQVDPLPNGVKHSRNTHDGQIFIYLVEGRMEVSIGEKTMELNVGDSFIFDGRQPHCFCALDGVPSKFIVIL